MSETSFSQRMHGVLDRLEQGIEMAAEGADVDLEVSRSGNVIEIEFADGAQMVINTHEAVGEVWVASRRAGYHFRPQAEGRWRDTRRGIDLLVLLTEEISVQAGRKLDLTAIELPH
ncbi:MAG: iron donor protein CyaY [Lautropia sp.]|nr:iron donor protein CyaY [Lautropia sp.]